MKVLHLAAGNRWTGAAAPAFAEVEALRAAGIDAHYAYVGGYRLEAKIGHLGFTHAAIEKSQNPLAFMRSLAAIQRLIDEHGFDVLHAHLTYDHTLACFVARKRRVRVARTFHSRRVLRRDPATRWMVRRTAHLFAINEAFRDSALLGERAVFTPPPVDHRQFAPEGAGARALHGIPADAKLVTTIGKVSKGRGFEEALRTFAELRRSVDCRMMIIGHGEHRPVLEELARELGIAEAVTWAGYHEDDLAEHYRASDVLLFTARGSDEGHRAVLEAMACGVPVATFPIEGVDALVPGSWIAERADPAALAYVASSLLASRSDALRREAAERSHEFGYARAARRLLSEYAM